MVEDVEKDRICGFTDWIGDSYYRVQSWIGKLNIRNYVSDVDSYHRKVIDKNNSSKKEIDRIFTKVANVDVGYYVKLRLLTSLLSQWDKFIVQLDIAINPKNNNISPVYMQTLSEIVSVDELTNLITASDFTAPVYSYDEHTALKNIIDLFSGAEDLMEGYLPGEIATIIEKLNDVSKFTTAASLASGLIGYSQAIRNLQDPSRNDTSRDRVQNLLKVDGELLSIYSTLLDLWKESELAGWIGLVKSSMSTVSELLNASGRSIEEQLKESGDLSTIGAVLAKAIWKISPEGQLEAFYMKHAPKADVRAARLEDYGNIAAIITGISMITRSIGDIIERAKDGVYDIPDYGDTLLDVGTYGMTKLASSVTFGVVDVEMERTKAIFDYNIETGQNLIHDTCGDSVVGKVVLTPFVIVDVAVLSVAETFIDKGMQIGGDIRELLGWD